MRRSDWVDGHNEDIQPVVVEFLVELQVLQLIISSMDRECGHSYRMILSLKHQFTTKAKIH